MGVAGDAETSGGGRIVIIAESVVFNGFSAPLSANGMPYLTLDQSPYQEVGGSGGYIYVNTTNKFLPNLLSKDISIESKGGFGTSGGSGGVIVLEGLFFLDDSQVIAVGGSSTNKSQIASGCGDGAAGTVYTKSNNYTRLVV
jgi:hypothetical protein